MRSSTIWQKILGVQRCVVEGIRFEDDGVLVASIRPYKNYQKHPRCSHCGRLCTGYDKGGGLRRWRGLDLIGSYGSNRFLRASRSACP